MLLVAFLTVLTGADNDKEPKTLSLWMRRENMAMVPNIKQKNWMRRKREKANNERRGECGSEGGSEKKQTGGNEDE
jgi:hypothetical protein